MTRTRWLLGALIGVGLILVACVGQFPVYRDKTVPMAAFAALDLGKYSGRWHEIARFPVPFQSKCAGATADYAPAAPGTISVVNRCLGPDGSEIDRIEGSARVTGPGQLKVRLGRMPFSADYWVLWVDEGYQTAVVGMPGGRAGWILNRGPDIPAGRLEAARQVFAHNGYDLTKLKRVASFDD